MITHKHTIKNFYTSVLLVLCGVLLAACAKEELIDLGDPGVVGTPVKVSLSFSLSSFETPVADNVSPGKTNVSPAFGIDLGRLFANDTALLKPKTRSDGNTLLYNLWVFQFGADKKIVKASKMPNTPEPLKDMMTIDVELVVGTNQTIYLVSLGKQYGDIDLSTIKNIAELENYPLQSIRYIDGVPQNIIQDEADIPYMGFCQGIDIVQLETGGRGYVKYNPASGFTGGIPMRAMISKVTFNFSYSVENLTPNMMVLNNVPTTFCINPAASYKPSSFVSLPAITFSENDFIDGKRYEAVWYIAPNKQGTVNTIALQKDRYFYYSGVTPTGSAPSEGTYINLWAADKTTANGYALYYIFLGSNTTSDFNVNPHAHYIMRSDINIPPNGDDKRVIYTTLNLNIDFKASSMISQPTSVSVGTGTKYNIDVSPGRRPIEITALRGTVTVDILRWSGDDVPIPVDDSWLQLSTSPNYTEAINRKKGGDPNALTTSISINTTTPGLIRLYLYNDEITDYSTNMATYMRTLHIRFRFKSETQPEQSYIYVMYQNYGFYMGRIGGERDINTGVYSHGLVCSDKFNTCGEEYLSYHKAVPASIAEQVNILKAGIYTGVQSYQNLIAEFGVANRETGKNATRLYAENSNGYPTISTLTAETRIPAPRWVNGKPDLYQYQGKYNSGNSFAARWCYDKNRDANGNGEIDEDEMVWYLPSYDQVRLFGLNFYGTKYYDEAKKVNSHFSLTSTFHDIDHPYWIRSYRPAANTYDSYSGLYDVRCVRDVKWPVTIKYGKEPLFSAAKVEVEAGYAVIDASGLTAGASAYKVKGDAYIRADGRNVRHLDQGYEEKSIAAVTSSRFRVAPLNIDTLGNPTTDPAKARMTWAQAAGFNTAVNQLTIDQTVYPAETGCAVYKQGADPSLGKWRMPTLNEMYLIEILEKTLLTTASSTGFTPLSYDSTLPGAMDKSRSCYWTGTEYNTVTTSIGKQAWVIMEDYTRTAAGEVTWHKRSSMNMSKANSYYVRCVQDLPPK